MVVYPNLRTAALSKGITQEQMANYIGIRAHSFSYRMTGKQGEFTVSEAFAIRDRFFPNLSIEWLFARAS